MSAPARVTSEKSNTPLKMRPPRYTGEEPLEERTEANDQRALKLAVKALSILRFQRAKTDSKCKGETENAEEDPIGLHPSSKKNETSTKAEPTLYGTDVDAEPEEDLSSDEYSRPIIYGPRPDVMLQMKSMYDGTGEWPKRKKGWEQRSWSNIGSPMSKDLVIKDFESDTSIDRTMPTVATLAQTVDEIRTRTAEEIADGGKVEKSTLHNRTVEDFTVNGWTATKVKFSDVDVFANHTGQTYRKCQTAVRFEEKVNKAIGKEPELIIEQWAASHVLLSNGGDIGGRTADYWRRARDLAQQQLYVNQGLEWSIRQWMRDDISLSDTAFPKMLEIVQEALTQKTENPYFQSQRDAYATENAFFHHVTAEITMVLDKNNNVIAFQCSDAFGKLLDKVVQRDVTDSFETFSTLQPVPLPDMTRHGIHYIDWLAERPEFDFRNLQNDPRLAKSGAYHFGVRCSTGGGTQDPFPTRDSWSRIDERSFVQKQQYRLQHKALGACTELVSFFFGILDPGLLKEYRGVVAEISKLGYLNFETRRTGEPFAIRALLVNLMTNDHRDVSGWRHGLAGLVAVGKFEGGDLLLRELGLRIESKPGSLQLIRGRELRHSITKWKGRRFVVVNTTHEAVRLWSLRQRVEEVPVWPPAPAGSTTMDDDCIDVNQEDILPEDQRILSEKELFPDRWEERITFQHEEEEENNDGGGSSEGEILIVPRTRQAEAKKVNSSSDASGELSDKDNKAAADIGSKKRKKQK